jgi:hypothetical protein
VTTIAIAETCLDSYVRYFSADQVCEGEVRPGISPSHASFPRKMQRTHLQRAAAHFGHHYTADEISTALQAYRAAQGRDGGQVLRYTVAARGYARSAWWFILDGPGFNREKSEELLLAHAKWVPEDVARRAAMDVISELVPAMEAADTAVNRIIGVCQTGIATMLSLMVDQISTQVDVGAATLSLDIENEIILTLDEELALASLMV